MSLIVSQSPINRLPPELVNNAAFVKQVDFDPVHQTAESGQPAERVNGIASNFDTISISAEALAKAKDIRPLSFTDGTDILSLDAEADMSRPFQQGPSMIDITDPASLERKKQGEALSRAMNSWNTTVEHLKQISESSQAYGYVETIKLFKIGYADWQAALQKSDPEAYGAWLRMLDNDK